MKKLAVVIVNYNVKHYVAQCLMSLRRALKGVDADVYVVDNHSRDGSVAFLSSQFADVKIIRCNHNQGFARANNLAINMVESEYVLLLNPDTIVGERSLRDTLAFMDEHPKAGGLGVCMLKSNGEKAMESRRGLPTPMVAFYKMCGLCARFPKSKRFGRYYMSGLSWDEAARIDVVSGAFFLLRRNVLQEVGLLDEDFFMYGEDIDLSYRILKGGYENWYFPTNILHYKGESTQKTSFQYVHVFYDAMLIFFRKHYAHSSFFLTIPIKTAIYTKAFFALIRMQISKMRKSLGFRVSQPPSAPLYVFMGSGRMIEQCRKIAMENGLKARYVEASTESEPRGHLSMAEELKASSATTYVVYDVASFSYEQIFGFFSEAPMPNVLIGTYDENTHTIITDREVFQ